MHFCLNFAKACIVSPDEKKREFAVLAHLKALNLHKSDHFTSFVRIIVGLFVIANEIILTTWKISKGVIFGKNCKKKLIFLGNCRAETNLGLKDAENQDNKEIIEFWGCFSKRINSYLKNILFKISKNKSQRDISIFSHLIFTFKSPKKKKNTSKL